MKTRTWTRAALILLFLLLIFLPLLLSLVVKYSLLSELETRGMSDVSVERLWLNPYTGVASIQNLKFSTDTDHYRLTDLELDLTLTDLWGQKVRVSGVRLISANLRLQQDAEGNLMINGINLAGDDTQEVVEEVVEEPEENASTWQFALDSLGVEDVHLLVDLPDVVADVSVQKIAIARLDTEEEQKGDVEILLTLNRLELPSAGLEAAVSLEFTTQLALERLELDDWKVHSTAQSTLSNLKLTVTGNTISLPETQLKLDARAQYSAGDWTLSADTETAVSRADINTADAAVVFPEAIIDLVLEAASQGGSQTIDAQTKLALSDLDVKASQLQATLPKTSLTLDLNGNASGEKQDAIINSTLVLSDLNLVADDTTVKLPELNLSLDAKGGSNGGNWQVSGNTNTVLSELDVVTPQALLQWARAEIGVEGEASSEDALNYQAVIEVLADQGAVQTGAESAGLKQAPLADLKHLSLGTTLTGSVSEDQSASEVSVKKLALTGLNLLPSKGQPTLVSDADFFLEGMTVKLPDDSQAMDVVVERLNLPKAKIAFVREADGSMPQLAAILSPQAQASKTDSTGEVAESTNETGSDNLATLQADKESSGTGIPVFVKHLMIGPEVSVDISDAGVKPTFEEVVRINQLQINNLSLKESSQPASLNMALLLNHDAAIKAEGSFNVVAPNADVKITLDEYQLLGLSGYSKEFTGYALEAGVFNLTSTVKLADNQLDTHNQAIINHVTLRPEHSDTVQQFAHSLTMPLDQALDLLRDSNDQIKLEVPVKGALDDPDVDIQQIINKALGGAMKKASMLVLQTLLQPYGAIITVAQMAGEKMTEVKLDSVRFAAGSAELNAVAKDYSGKIAAMLKERDALTLKMCGVTNLGDLQVVATEAGEKWPEVTAEPAAVPATDAPQSVQLLEEKYTKALKDLAVLRTDNLKRHLRDDLGVPSPQLLVCLPRHQADNKVPASVELSF
ncbi:DUF748 domain-containing protein [Aestuariicella sp. G3-2]|uniref:DUF748 domain-containing protein n=1 Tax=Pseudomaricurvus albidus TaxID=2842452 RepID=UPI001C0BFADC|nr:DUF748 domain-containing protein [Aestuariicella albida]MBU3068876.1 DUF748 domain-containing protein [Aestuariicella albida]